MLYLGVDLAWTDNPNKPSPESGVVALAGSGQVLDADWTTGIDETRSWINQHRDSDCLLFVDAPLQVDNPTGQRLCETHVGQRYGRWKVSANSTNLGSARLGGVRLRKLLEGDGWIYDDGIEGPPTAGRIISECYPYTTIVGAPELGYDHERPTYKRKPKSIKTAEFRTIRVAVCDELIQRVDRLAAADVPIALRSHPVTAQLVVEPSPVENKPYKHREDLLDAALCSWTAALWHQYGFDRCQVLGDDPNAPRPLASIIAPARPEQRPETASGPGRR